MRELKWAPGSISVVDYMLRPDGEGRRRFPDLDGYGRLVYITLFSYMGDDLTCHPSIATVANGAGDISKRTVQRRIEELENLGLLETNRKVLAEGKGLAGGGRAATTYTLHPPWAPKAIGDSTTQVSHSHPTGDSLTPPGDSLTPVGDVKPGNLDDGLPNQGGQPQGYVFTNQSGAQQILEHSLHTIGFGKVAAEVTAVAGDHRAMILTVATANQLARDKLTGRTQDLARAAKEFAGIPITFKFTTYAPGQREMVNVAPSWRGSQRAAAQ